MNKFEELKQTWTISESYQSDVQQRVWDRVADHYGAHPIPTFEENYFLRYINEAVALTRDLCALDIGCGSGVYSMALAPLIGEAIGVDISPKMIEHANSRCSDLGINNAKFYCMDWSRADIDELGFRGAFDIVFAHMTPAVVDFSTFDKLNACSRNLCLMEKPTRRKDSIQDEAFRLVGINNSQEQFHGGVLEAFTFLWYSGRCPQFYYHDTIWDGEKTVEDMVAWCIDRAKLKKQLTAKDEAVIREFVESQAVDGIVREITTTTKVTMIWRVQ